MNKRQRTKLADVWHGILNANSKELFGPSFRLLRNRNWGDRLAQPGFVGPRYEPGGVLFVGMNPGGGPNNGIGELDRQQFSALQRLRDATPVRRLAAFDAFTELQPQIMLRWRLIQNYVLPMLDGTGIGLDSVAYLNLLKWRTVPGASLNRLYTLSWRAHTAEQFRLLCPSVVIPLGTGVGQWLGQRCPLDDEFHYQPIPRLRNDNIGKQGKKLVRMMNEFLTAFAT